MSKYKKSDMGVGVEYGILEVLEHIRNELEEQNRLKRVELDAGHSINSSELRDLAGKDELQ